MTNSVGNGDARFGQDEFSTTAFVVDQIMAGMATATLVKVMAVGTGTVDVQPLVNQTDGRGTGTPHGTIHGLPYFTMRAGPVEIRIKPRVGDIGAAVFCHSDISKVKATKAQANPGTRRRFNWSDGLYFGGFLSSGDATTFIEIDADNNVSITCPTLKIAADTVDASADLALTGAASVSGAVDTATEYRVDGVKVVGNQAGPIAAPTGGSTIDTNARVTISAILSALRGHGLIST